MKPLWYLGSPYSKYPLGLNAAHKAVCENAALLIEEGVAVYSPIAHTHPIALHGQIDPLDHGIWLPIDAPLMAAADGLIVLKLMTWDRSSGLAFEIKGFAAADKPIVYMEPGIVPAEVRGT